MSLRVRLLVLATGLAIIALGVVDVATYVALRSSLYTQIDRSLHASAATLGENLPSIRPVEEQDLNTVITTTPGLYAGIASSGATVSWHPLGGQATLRATPPPSVTTLAHLPATPNASPVTLNAQSGELRYRVVMESTSPSRSVFLAEPLTGVDQTLDRLLTIEIIVSLAAVAAVLGIGAWLISLTLRPLTQIERAASEIAAGNLSRRVDGARERDEVGRLAIAFNVMIERIEHLFAEQSSSASVLRQFVADASHELRTPLTAVRAYAELFERGAKDHPEDLERAMQGIQRESGRMSMLVDDLLLLARLDQHPETVWQEIDLTEIARNAIDAARIIEPQRTVTFSGENAVVIQGDPEALRRAIDNLLTNVRMHTPARTTAQVSITRDAEGALICVRDNGPGMSDELRSQAFARFTRGDTSRSREAGGAGLGLAIVAAIADVHNGTVAVTEATDTGTAITIRIPITQKTHSRT